LRGYERIGFVIYCVVDAFADEVFKGNPAGVCLLEDELDDWTMQRIAAENNLSETAFLQKKENYYGLRWFTPTNEVDLCGHATLASAYVVLNSLDKSLREVRFETKSGTLLVSRDGELYTLNFPSNKPKEAIVTDAMRQVAGVPIQVAGIPIMEAYISEDAGDLILILESEKNVQDFIPDFHKLSQLAGHAVTITAKGDTVDFVSRFFAPNVGIPEDPVTGSAHTRLIPLWAAKLGKKQMIAAQLSKRGGTLYCEDCGDRVKISGKAVLYLEGGIHIG
jgi:PhzF family phenazine biosynthesis protein